MSKEYLDAFKNLKQELYYSPNQIPDVDKWHETIEQALQRLNTIDNAEPSEALEEIKTLRGFNQVELNNDENVNKSLDIIKQALLKAQEFNEILEKYYIDDLDELNTILTNYRKHYR